MTEYRLLNVPTCDLCAAVFDEGVRTPRIFGLCGHTYCEVCLASSLEKVGGAGQMALACGVCGKTLHSPPKELSGFPRNFGVLDVIQTFMEETVCDHQAKAPAEFVCLSNLCLSRQRFCGMCRFTVHSRCDPRLILRAADFPSRAKLKPVGLGSEHFSVLCEQLRVRDGSLAALGQHLDRLLAKASGSQALPTLRAFLDNRADFRADPDPATPSVLLQSRRLALWDHIDKEYLGLVGPRASPVTAADVLSGLPSLWAYLSPSKQQRELLVLLRRHPSVAGECLQRIDETVYQSADLFRAIFEAYRNGCRENGVLTARQHRLNRLKALHAKAVMDEHSVEQAKAEHHSKVADVTEGLARDLKAGRRRVPGIVVLSRSQIRQLSETLDPQVAAIAGELTAVYGGWFLKQADCERLRTAQEVLQSVMAEQGLPESDLLATAVQSEPQLLLDKSRKAALKAMLLEGSSAAQLEEWLDSEGLFQGSYDMDFEQLLFVVESVEPAVAEDLREAMDPYFQFPEESWVGFLEANGLPVAEDGQLPETLAPFRPRKWYEVDSECLEKLRKGVREREAALPRLQAEERRLEGIREALAARAQQLDSETKELGVVEACLRGTFAAVPQEESLPKAPTPSEARGGGEGEPDAQREDDEEPMPWNYHD